MMHITNGDSAAITLRASGVPGEVLPWRDVLHEGPVPAGLSLTELSDVRARFIAEQRLGGAYDDVLAGFRERDAALAGCTTHDEVVLWFEHDLYDQLQLLQLLDWFADHERGATRLSLISIGSLPGRVTFGGLGELTTLELAGLFPTRYAVTEAELSLGRTAWHAFRSPDPTAIERVLVGDTSALPFLHAALHRHLEEFPSAENGLSRTERELLTVIKAGSQTLRAVFTAWQATEDTIFMGDTPLWMHLRFLAADPHPLVALADGGSFRMPAEFASPDEFVGQRVVLTDAGRVVLAGQADQIALRGVNRWLGGAHLQAGGPFWRWQTQRQQLVQS